MDAVLIAADFLEEQGTEASTAMAAELRKYVEQQLTVPAAAYESNAEGQLFGASEVGISHPDNPPDFFRGFGKDGQNVVSRFFSFVAERFHQSEHMPREVHITQIQREISPRHAETWEIGLSGRLGICFEDGLHTEAVPAPFPAIWQPEPPE